MPDKEPPDLVKEAINNAIKEWMDEKYRAVGRNTVHCICILGFCLFVRALIHFHMLDVDGWRY